MIRLIPALLLLGACSDFPRDTEGTLDRIEREGRFTLAVEHAGSDRAAPTAAFVGRLSRQAKARPVIGFASGERLLIAVETGKVDLAIMPLDPKSPWAHRVAIGPRLIEGTGSRPETAPLVPVSRNGENAWADRIHRAAQAP